MNEITNLRSHECNRPKQLSLKFTCARNLCGQPRCCTKISYPYVLTGRIN